jgi:hypothetical protein
MLEAELTATPSSAAGQLLHRHRTLALDYGTLGDFQSARRHGVTWNQLSEDLLGADDPYTLSTRSNIASFTGECEDPVEALRLFRELLPDQTGPGWQPSRRPDHVAQRHGRRGNMRATSR